MTAVFSHYLLSLVGAAHPARIPTCPCLPQINLKSHPQPTVFLLTSSPTPRKIARTCHSTGTVPTSNLD